jgi:YggT family protein
MSGSYLVNPAVFLIDTLFSLYILAIMLRFLLQWVEADFYNPISQFVVKMTHPPLRLTRRILPSIGRIDTASVVLMLVVQALAGSLLFLVQGVDFSLGFLAFWSIAQLLDLLFNVYLFSLIAIALLSWISPAPRNSAVSLLHSLTYPILRMFRRIIPPVGGLDLSALVALIVIQVTKMLVMQPLLQLAASFN